MLEEPAARPSSRCEGLDRFSAPPAPPARSAHAHLQRGHASCWPLTRRVGVCKNERSKKACGEYSKPSRRSEEHHMGGGGLQGGGALAAFLQHWSLSRVCRIRPKSSHHPSGVRGIRTRGNWSQSPAWSLVRRIPPTPGSVSVLHPPDSSTQVRTNNLNPSVIHPSIHYCFSLNGVLGGGLALLQAACLH